MEEDSMNIKKGDPVQFKKGLYADEEEAIYTVLEVNGDRCFIELLNTNMAIRPQSAALLSDLDLYNFSDNAKRLTE